MSEQPRTAAINRVTHTPGPWRVEEEPYCAPSFRVRSERYGIATAHSGMDDEWPDNNQEAEANARLIAAAPTLLALVKSIRADASAYQWHSATEAAIAKAEGR